MQTISISRPLKMAENVRVIVRCRPMNKNERAIKSQNIIHVEDCTLSVTNPTDLNAPAKVFTFDNVYSEIAPTEAIYNDICYTLVDNVLEGYNGTIFAYGQTGCGKTHTMQGPDINEYIHESTVIANSQRGIITRSFDHIFEAISVANDVRYLVLASYLEIYNENIRDLLNPDESVTANHTLKEVPGVGITVPTLSTHTVHNAKECYELLNMGNRNRMVGATLINANSSRSHSIFTLSLEQMSSVENIVGGSIRRGKLNLVDLAGSERQNKTGAVGERLKEATKINLSLSALGNVISALVDGKTKHIPYRDSKLTRLLQDSLGGNTKTLMISCISPADINYDETISTLRYASRAKNIANKPKINEDPKDAKLREYQEEIIKLKRLLSESTSVTTLSDVNALQISMQMERDQLQQKMAGEMQHLRDQHVQQQREKEEQQLEFNQLRERYEDQLKTLTITSASKPTNATSTTILPKSNVLQLEARKRIELIKQALVGGECAHDLQLRERRQKKKVDAQRRLSALAHLLSRVEQNEDRDLLQGHYKNIQQELNMKNENLKAYRQKVKALEQEISDLQAEFQLDRSDYLETIRRLEQNLKFYQQMINKALPILRKDGKYWDPDEILQNSCWNDDLKIWKLPEEAMNSFRLPPANSISSQFNSYFENHAIRTVTTATKQNLEQDNMLNLLRVEERGQQQILSKEKEETIDQDDSNQLVEQINSNFVKNIDVKRDDNIYKENILQNYFRSHRQKLSSSTGPMELTLQRKDYIIQRQLKQYQQDQHPKQKFQLKSFKSGYAGPKSIPNKRLIFDSTVLKSNDLSSIFGVTDAYGGFNYENKKYIHENNESLNKTWAGTDRSQLASTLSQSPLQ